MSVLGFKFKKKSQTFCFPMIQELFNSNKNLQICIYFQFINIFEQLLQLGKILKFLKIQLRGGKGLAD